MAFDMTVVRDLNPPVGVDECMAAARTTCTNVQTCSPFLLKVAFTDFNTCVAGYARGCQTGVFAPGANGTPAGVAMCTAARQTVDCTLLLAVLLENVDPARLPAACQAVAGSGASGAMCAAATQCASGPCALGGDVCGTCQPGNAGDKCVVDFDCKGGLGCALQKCVAYGNVGDACSNAAPCHRYLACVSGKCKQPGKLGDACDPNMNPCDTFTGDGLVCNSVSHKCEPFAFTTVGQTCGLDGTSGKYTLCSDGSACIINDTLAQTGTCTARAKVGETCSANGLFDPLCEVFVACQRGTCALGDPTTCRP
jgi:hypothetical protein